MDVEKKMLYSGQFRSLRFQRNRPQSEVRPNGLSPSFQITAASVAAVFAISTESAEMSLFCLLAPECIII